MPTFAAVRLPVVIVLLLAGAHAQAEPERVPPVAVAAEGRHFRVLCHFESRAVAREALAVAEAAWRPTTRVLGIEPKLDKPIDIHLYRTPAVYRIAEAAITNGKFARNNAFSSWAHRNGHVALEPVYSDALLARIGLTVQTRRTIAHEAAHLVVYHAWPHYRQHPRWLSEGIAIWAADEAIVPSGTVKALGTRPYAARRIVRFRGLAEDDRLPPLQDLLRWDRYRDLEFHDRYAFWWGFFRHLYTGPRAKAFRKLLEGVAALPDGGAFRGALYTAASAALGDDEGSLDPLRAELVAFGKGVDALWDEPIRTLDARGRTAWQLAFPESNAMCWRRQPAGPAPYRIEGTLEIEPVAKQQMNVLLGRVPEAGFVSVAFRATTGVTMFRYDAVADRWHRLGHAAHAGLSAGKRLRFRIAVDGRTVAAFVGGTRVLVAEVPDHPLDGPWGLGVQAAGAGAWTDVALRR